jgi:hypothetical protein
LTVLGTLTTKGDRDIAKVNAAGPLVTYLLRLDSGGGSFGGDVILIGSLPSKLGGEAVFFGNLTARGTVIIDGVTFNGGAEFNGPVEFIGPEGSVIIAPGKEVVLNGPVTVSNVNPVNLLNGQFKAGDALPGYTYNIPIEFSEDTAITGGTVSFTKPVTFNSTVDLTYVTGTFSAGVIFNDNVTFGTGIYYFGTYAANNDYKTSFAKTLKLKSAQLYGGSFGLPVTFNSAATFTGGSVAFNGQADFKGDLTLSEAAGTFTGGAQFAQNVNFAAGSQVTIGANTTLTHSSGLVIAPIGKTTVGYIIPDAEATGDFVTLLDASGKFTIPKGTLSLGSASIDITNGGEIVIGVKGGREAGIVFGTEGTPVAQAGLVYIKSSAYEIAAGTSAGGTLVGFLGTVASAGADTITLSNNSFTSSGPKGGSRSQAVLKFAGSNTATNDGKVGAPTLTIKSDITIDGVTLDIAEDTAGKQTAGSIAVKGSPVITLKGGLVTIPANGGTVSNGAAGGIRIGAGTAVFGGNYVNTTAVSGTTIADGYLVGLNGKLVTGSGSSAYDEEDAGTKGILGTTDNNTVLLISTSTNPGFAVYYKGVGNAAAAKATVANTAGFTETSLTETGGSVAVFAGTILE